MTVTKFSILMIFLQDGYAGSGQGIKDALFEYRNKKY